MGMGLCVAVLECAKLIISYNIPSFRVIRESLYGGLNAYIPADDGYL